MNNRDEEWGIKKCTAYYRQCKKREGYRSKTEIELLSPDHAIGTVTFIMRSCGIVQAIGFLT